MASRSLLTNTFTNNSRILNLDGNNIVEGLENLEIKVEEVENKVEEVLHILQGNEPKGGKIGEKINGTTFYNIGGKYAPDGPPGTYFDNQGDSTKPDNPNPVGQIVFGYDNTVRVIYNDDYKKKQPTIYETTWKVLNEEERMIQLVLHYSSSTMNACNALGHIITIQFSETFDEFVYGKEYFGCTPFTGETEDNIIINLANNQLQWEYNPNKDTTKPTTFENWGTDRKPENPFTLAEVPEAEHFLLDTANTGWFGYNPFYYYKETKTLALPLGIRAYKRLKAKYTQKPIFPDYATTPFVTY